MTTILKKLPGHFESLDDTENAIQFAFALVEEKIDVEVSSVIEAGERWMLVRCKNGKEEAFKRLCEQYQPKHMIDDQSEV